MGRLPPAAPALGAFVSRDAGALAASICRLHGDPEAEIAFDYISTEQ
jgi:hypothetical protein